MVNPVTRSLVLNDIRRNKAINTSLFLFIFMSALLMATGTLVIDRLSGSLDQILDIAQPPHFMQMHIGPVDSDLIADFAESTGLVKSYEIQEMVNIEGTNIGYTRKDLSQDSFSDSVMDNYFVRQNQNFDFLLDMNNEKVTVQSGEVGIPVSYAKPKNIQVGDQLHVTVQGKILNLKVTSLVRDAQMGSSLASSIRFVVSDQDFKDLKANTIRHESIISFRLHKESDINTFSDMYLQPSADLPKNGVAITLPLIRLINGIGDGLMSGVLMIVGLIIIGIAILNIRFTVLATLEEEVKSMGTLKAIGLNDKDLTQVYRAKYQFLSVIACLLAALCSFGTADFFTSNIALNFGVSKTTLFTYASPVIAVIVLHLLIMTALGRMLKAVSKMTILEALSESSFTDTGQKKKNQSLLRFKPHLKFMDAGLGLHLYKTHFKAWSLLIVVFLLSTFAILLPLSLYMTMDSPDFTNYVGAAKSDLRISVEYKPELEGVLTDISNHLATDPSVGEWHPLNTLRGKILTGDEGEKILTSFLLESGDYNHYPIKMDQGVLPLKSGEISLSALNQKRLGLQLGDTLDVTLKEKPIHFKVVGIYQDITNGGLTAKISKHYDGELAQVSYFVNTKPDVDPDALAKTWSKQFPRAKITSVEKLLDQTLGTITDSLGLSVIAVFIIAIAIVSLISVLFITLQMQKRHFEDAMLLSLGFEEKAIRLMYFVQSGLSMIIGVSLGALLTLSLGESMISTMLSFMSFGLTKVKYLIQPLPFMAMGCLVPLAFGLFMTWQVTRRIAHTHLSGLGNE